MQYNATKETLDGSEISFTGEISAETFETYRAHAIEHLGRDMEIPGFRKGKAPEHIIKANIPEMVVLEEMANHAVMDVYPKLLTEHNVNALGQPAIQITKIAANNPLGFVIRTAVMPEVELPDYKAIASKTSKLEKTDISDEEFEKALTQLRELRAKGIKENKERIEKEKNEEGSSETVTEEKTSETETETPTELPELTDEFVQTLGAFENVDDFKTKYRENLRLDKEHKARETNRLAIMERILAETKASIPKILIEGELDRMLYRMKTDISGMGLSYDEYLKHLGKSEETMRDEFRADAEKRVKMEILISEIAQKENITPNPETVAKEIEQVLKMYPSADRSRAEAYVEQILINEEVFKLLEGNETK